jgi:hypothetical protein
VTGKKHRKYVAPPLTTLTLKSDLRVRREEKTTIIWLCLADLGRYPGISRNSVDFLRMVGGTEGAGDRGPASRTD